MNRTSNAPRQLNFLFNAYQAVMGRGGQIDWSRVTSFFARGKFTVKLSAASAVGDTSLDVDALTQAITDGTTLDFGEVETVTVTVNDADVNAGETGITVTALTGPLPIGAVLQFSGSGAGFAKLSAAAAEGATALVVEALAEDIDNGATATYQGGRKLAVATADVAAGAVAIPVEPLQFAVADNAEALADFTGTSDKRSIPAGTVMARTSTDKLIPRRDADAETATEILQSDANEGSLVDAKSGYGTLIEAQVFENLMPDADTDGNVSGTYKTELATNGARINFSDWSDSRFTD